MCSRTREVGGAPLRLLLLLTATLAAACNSPLSARSDRDATPGRDVHGSVDARIADAAPGTPDALHIPSCGELPEEPAIAFTTHSAPPQFDANNPAVAMVVADGVLYYYDVIGGTLARKTSAEGGWQPLKPIDKGRVFQRDASQFSSSMVFYSGDGAEGVLLVLRELDSELSSNVARYDIASDNWTIDTTPSLLTHGLNVVGDHLYGLHHAGGEPLRRYSIATTDPELGADLSGVEGDDALWISRAAELVLANGYLYGIKNDWASPQSLTAGDRLYRFAPGDYEVGSTPVDDLGLLPFEPGAGSTLVWLPPGWSGETSSMGALFMTAGYTASDREGYPVEETAAASDVYYLYDLACEVYRSGSLPAPSARGTSAAFFQGHLVIKKGADEPPNQPMTCCDDFFWVSD